MVQAQLKPKFSKQIKGHGRTYVERTMSSACNDNFTPVGVWCKRLLPFAMIIGGLLLLL